MSLARVRTRRYGAKVNPMTRAQWVGATVIVAGLLFGGIAYAMKAQSNAVTAKKWVRDLSNALVAGKTYRFSFSDPSGTVGGSPGPFPVAASDLWEAGSGWTVPPSDWPAGDGGAGRVYTEARAKKDAANVFGAAASDPNGDTRVWVQG